MDIHFDCTQCGRCCHDLKLPLSIDEAQKWAGNGHQVDLLIEAAPSFDEPAEGSPERYRYDRSFPGTSGTVPIRISMILVASFTGACPHLRADRLCGNYEERPRVCRIYPAEVNPQAQLQPSQKACPPEAWLPDLPVLARDGALRDPTLSALIEDHRSAARSDVPAKLRVCAMLGIRSAAFANEGYAVFSPRPDDLRRALEPPQDEAAAGSAQGPWDLVTNRRQTATMLESVEASVRMTRQGDGYIAFFDDDAGDMADG